MSTNFFKTKPYDHQIEALNRGMNQSSYGYLMEMGTGKSKVLIDNLAGLALQNKVNFALIIAPKGVYRNWVAKESPEHMSEQVTHRVIRWVANPNKTQKAEMQSLG